MRDYLIPELIIYWRLLVVRLAQHSHSKAVAVRFESQEALEECLRVLVVLPAVRPRDFQDITDAVLEITRFFIHRLMAENQGKVDHPGLGLDLRQQASLGRSEIGFNITVESTIGKHVMKRSSMKNWDYLKTKLY